MTSSRRLLAGRYEVGEYIGQGGMSTVYKGLDTKLGRPVAIKIMKAALAVDSDFRERFRQEAHAASRMAHPSIVRVYDAGDELIQTGIEVQRLPFIVMEFVPGKNLKQVASEKPLSLEETTRVVEALLTALEYSHRAGIVHRDIKPANIMISEQGQVKVMDFGIARAASETSSTLQQTTSILGTAAYFSPEQAKGETVDTRTDLYSAGVVLYELLVGDVPFKGDTAVAVAYQHVSEKPPLPSSQKSDIPSAYDRVVMHALIKDKNRRFQTAAEFREALKQASEGVTPKLGKTTSDDEVLFTGGIDVSESEQALQRLTDSSTSVRSQPRPPVMWTWAAILTVMAVVGAVVFWITQLSAIDLTPQNTREIPDLSNVSQEVALDTLQQQNLVGIPIPQTDSEVPANMVISTDPAAGVIVETGQTVKLYVSSGPVEAVVPRIEGLPLKDATEELKNLGLQVGLTSTVDDPVVKGGSVISVNPAPGEKLPAGSSVDLVISSGKVTVPDVKGQSMAMAQTLLEPTRLLVEETPEPSCPQQANLPIINQSVVGQVEQFSTIQIYYCSG
ncbi:MAG TPA: Stk1 family PASTA domain-containing Ser/Thr kinase [Microbacteriaceae bacterium]|nr:Stk1 family PASTA domain-containing Ser/Thr kinase [Microbacteriaceae bacterium]